MAAVRLGVRSVRRWSVLAVAVLLLPAAPARAEAGPAAGAAVGVGVPSVVGLPPWLPFIAVVRPVDPVTAADMTGLSWRPGCPVPLADLRLVDMTFWGFDGRPHLGELVVHMDVAWDVAGAFRTLYEARFPIRRMERVDRYGADDDASMAADNTSGFNCRPVTGSTSRFSIHSYGKAIDINTIENPYVSSDLGVLPPAGAAFTDRTDVRPGMVVAGDVVTRAFARIGFAWGGDWDDPTDYQHFETIDDPRPPV